MSLRRFLVGPGSLERELVALDGDEAAHARKVLRLKAGDQVALIDGQGGWARARLTRLDKKSAACQVIEKCLAPRPEPRLVLGLGLLKAGALDELAAPLTELGVDQVRPFSCGRAVAGFKNPAARLERWGRLAGQALKQSGNLWLPEFHPPMDLGELLAAAPADASKLLLYEDERSLSLGQALADRAGAGEVWALIGPEGGFEPEEVSAAKEAGWTVCGLPGNILRAKTAALAAAAVVRFRS